MTGGYTQAVSQIHTTYYFKASFEYENECFHARKVTKYTQNQSAGNVELLTAADCGETAPGTRQKTKK